MGYGYAGGNKSWLINALNVQWLLHPHSSFRKSIKYYPSYSSVYFTCVSMSGPYFESESVSPSSFFPLSISTTAASLPLRLCKADKRMALILNAAFLCSRAKWLYTYWTGGRLILLPDCPSQALRSLILCICTNRSNTLQSAFIRHPLQH